MKTTIDSAGRLVIPKKLREAAGIEPGMPLEIRCRDGRIEVEPATVEMHLERRGRFLVLVADEPVPTLTTDDVNALIDKMRAERGTIYPEDQRD